MKKPNASPALITIPIMLATIMQALDTTIANVALPHMQGSLAATQDQISWVLTSYIVAAAIMMAPSGFISARIGRKRLFIISVVGFTIASMLCGIATSLDQMVLYRLLQGVFGAALVPLSQATLLDIYPREKHGSAMAMWGVGVMLGPILGPTLGGYLTEYYNWRWVFFINLPIGIFALLGIVALVPETEIDRNRPFDAFGFAWLSLALGALQMMLDRGELKDWFSSTEIVVEATLSGLGFYMFIVHMMTHAHPFLTPRLFKDRNFVIGLLFIFVVGIILLATMALLPPFLQNLKHYPVVTTGYVMAPRGIGTMISMLVVGRLLGKFDVRLIILVGLGLAIISLWQMSNFNFDTDISALTISGIIQGLGLGGIFVPLSAITFATLEPSLRTEATALFSLMRNLGSAIGVSIVNWLLSRNTQINHAELSQHITVLNPLLKAPYAPDMWSPTERSGLIALDQLVNAQASMISYLNDFLFMMWITIAAIPMLLLLRKPRKAQSKEEAEAEAAAAIAD